MIRVNELEEITEDDHESDVDPPEVIADIEEPDLQRIFKLDLSLSPPSTTEGEETEEVMAKVKSVINQQ